MDVSSPGRALNGGLAIPYLSSQKVSKAVTQEHNLGDYQALDDVRCVRKRREAGDTAYNDESTAFLHDVFEEFAHRQEPDSPQPRVRVQKRPSRGVEVTVGARRIAVLGRRLQKWGCQLASRAAEHGA